MSKQLVNGAATSGSRSVRVLIVEDNPADVRLLTSLFDEHDSTYELASVRDGEQALSYLAQHGLEESSRPDLIFLDLNLPRIDGKEVLRRIRAQQRFKSIPIIVLTTSDHQDDIRLCYELGANCFLTKPGDLEGMTSLFKSVEDFWFNHAQLPTLA